MRSLIALLFIAAIPAHGSWARVDVEVLVDHADLVVVGKVIRIDPGKDGHEYAVISASKILKDTRAPAAGKPPRTLVKVRQLATGTPLKSTSLRNEVGKRGAWILTAHASGTFHTMGHPSAFVSRPAKLPAMVAARAALKGGPAVGGLVARSELVTERSATGTYYRIRFSIGNTTKAPIVICTYAKQRPLKVDWTGPGGKQKSAHYQLLARLRMGPIHKGSFLGIPAGGVRHVGPFNHYSFIAFSTAKMNGTNLVGPGKHSVTVRFVSAADGTKFGIKAWNGTLTSPSVTWTVK